MLIADFWYSGWATMHKTTEDKALGKQWMFLMIFFYFPGALSSVVLCMIAQLEYEK